MADQIEDARRGERLMRAARYLAFAVVVLAPAAASWHGLVALGRDWLSLGDQAPLVPLTLDAAALYMAVLTWRSTLAGDAAGVDRLLVWAYAGGSAGLQLWYHDAAGGLRTGIFYAIASVSAALVWERTLRAMRRQELRELGAIDSPAPRFRLLRWVLHTRETWGAWRLAIGESITDPREALAAYRASGLPALSPRGERTSRTDEDYLRTLADNSETPFDLSELNKRQALAVAFEAVGLDDVPAARLWLAERGIYTDRSAAYKRAKQLLAARGPHLAIVGGEQR